MTLDLPSDGCFVGRIWHPGVQGPAVVARRGDRLFDITCPDIPTMQALLEHPDPVTLVATARGSDLGTLAEIAANSTEAPEAYRPYPLAPCDLQPVKACGVTFVTSMLERVIEEKAKVDPVKADKIRARCTEILGDSLRAVFPGSDNALALKEALIAEDVWSQYLQVGIGKDAEVFSKAQPIAAVGFGASVGLHPFSTWNNPEP